MKKTIFLYCIVFSFSLFIVARVFDQAKANPQKHTLSLSRSDKSRSDTTAANRIATSAKDSTIVDQRTHVISLYGDALFKYKGMEVQADRIELNQYTKTGTATGSVVLTDKSRKMNLYCETIKFDWDGL